jgi:hypothetical protein
MKERKRMIMKKVVMMLSVIWATFLLPNYSYSQADVCGADVEDCGPFTKISGPNLLYEIYPACWVELEVFIRECPSTSPPSSQYRYEIIMPFQPSPNNCDYPDFSDEQIKDLLDLQATQFIGTTIPACPPGGAGGKRIVKYEEVACEFVKRCSTDVVLTSDLECNDGTTESRAGQTVTYVERSHLPCGTACCEISYDACSKSYSINGVTQLDRIISNVSKSEFSPCTLPPPGTTASDCRGCQ